MKILAQCGIIFGICVAGEVLHTVTRLPVPGNVFGMIILFLLLYFKVIQKQQIKRVSKFLIGNMAFFFIPSGVAIIAYFDTIRHVLVPYLLIIVLTTLIVLGVTGHFAQWMQRLMVRAGFRQKVGAARAARRLRRLRPAVQGAAALETAVPAPALNHLRTPQAGVPVSPRRPPHLPPKPAEQADAAQTATAPADEKGGAQS